MLLPWPWPHYYTVLLYCSQGYPMQRSALIDGRIATDDNLPQAANFGHIYAFPEAHEYSLAAIGPMHTEGGPMLILWRW